MICDVVMVDRFQQERVTEQWIAAQDQADRYGQQLAALQLNFELAGSHHDAVHKAWSMFLEQFDKQVHYLLRDAYQSGYTTTWNKIMLERTKNW